MSADVGQDLGPAEHGGAFRIKDVHPATKLGGVAGDLPPCHGHTALVDVHPAAAGLGGVAEDICPFQARAAQPGEHSAAAAPGVARARGGVVGQGT